MDSSRTGAVERVFAGELNRSSVTLTQGNPPITGVLTPTGAWLGRIFMVGVLTEVIRRGEEVHRARLSDPTGTVDLVLRPHNLPPGDLLQSVNPPAFLALTGSVRMRGNRVVIEPDMLMQVQKPERDDWLLFTAERTIQRMEAVQEALGGRSATAEITAVLTQYPSPKENLRDLAALVRVALDAAPAQAVAPSIDAEAVVREIIFAHPGVLEIAWVLERAAEQGVSGEDARRGVLTLLAEGECYSPRNGHIKLL
jgi:RPA family protein